MPWAGVLLQAEPAEDSAESEMPQTRVPQAGVLLQTGPAEDSAESGMPQMRVLQAEPELQAGVLLRAEELQAEVSVQAERVPWAVQVLPAGPVPHSAPVQHEVSPLPLWQRSRCLNRNDMYFPPSAHSTYIRY